VVEDGDNGASELGVLTASASGVCVVTTEAASVATCELSSTNQRILTVTGF
jgi:hypothetical protein